MYSMRKIDSRIEWGGYETLREDETAYIMKLLDTCWKQIYLESNSRRSVRWFGHVRRLRIRLQRKV